MFSIYLSEAIKHFYHHFKYDLMQQKDGYKNL